MPRPPAVVEYDGRAMTLLEWSREFGVPTYTIRMRLARGWPVAKALAAGARVWSKDGAGAGKTLADRVCPTCGRRGRRKYTYCGRACYHARGVRAEVAPAAVLYGGLLTPEDLAELARRKAKLDRAAGPGVVATPSPAIG